MRSIFDAGDVNKKKVLVRVDWNVPIKDGKVLDDFRIRQSLPTLEYLRRQGADIVIATHLDPVVPIEPVYEHARGIFPMTFKEESEVTLLENLRLDPREEANDMSLAEELVQDIDLYINEAFSVSHREHASIVGVPKLVRGAAGAQFVKEVENLSKAFNPARPSLFILGGAKFDTKLPLVEKFLGIADSIYIAGGNAKPASETRLKDEEKVILPEGDLAAPDLSKENLNILQSKINESEFILWNGPLGKYQEGYLEGTLELGRMLAKASLEGREVIVGGADTLAVLEKEMLGKYTFVSTGGGAMLDFLANGTLPGIEALG